MQRYLYTFFWLFLIFFLVSCEKEEVPAKSTIKFNKQHVQVDEEVTIKAIGGNSIYHEWDLGNGTVSFDYINTVKYDAPGRYTIRLKTISPDKKITETLSYVLVGKIYLKGFSIKNFNFKGPDGKPWDEDGSGPDISVVFSSLRDSTPFVFHDVTQISFPISRDDFWTTSMPREIISELLTITLEEISPQAVRPIKSWTIKPSELLLSQDHISASNTNIEYALPGNYPRVTINFTFK